MAFFLLICGVYSVAAEDEKTANRLANEKSPYLLKHATNPVDWYPWGEEAFEKARADDKPIFLSIGYSTCHWCNVMEEESFSDATVAKALNEVFIPIKVDREERPDIDQIYMSVCQIFTENCGWPLTIFLTPDKRPFFAGTYFPKKSRFGRPGLLNLIDHAKNLWSRDRERVLQAADEIKDSLERSASFQEGEGLSITHLKNAYELFNARFDELRGGFGSGIKFPKPHVLSYLLRYWKRSGEKDSLRMAEETLTAMRHGGIYDHLGYGFHRYSTDPWWRVPHFEKMLYDQALHAIAYLEAYQATKNEQYANTAREILQYVLRDMTSSQGGFYSAESADSEGEEGKFYIWKQKELIGLLGKKTANEILDYYHIEPDGNFVDPVFSQKSGENILYTTEGIEKPANLEAIRRILYNARNKRIRPDKDDKVLADWNGLMIAALARAAQVFNEPEYGEAAAKAADFVLTNMMSPQGKLLHRWRDGQSGLPATAADYAYFTWGLIELYEWSFNVKRLDVALRLKNELIKDFWDNKAGGFFLTGSQSETVLVRMKDVYDRALPSSNSVAMLNLLRLGRLTGKADFEEKAAMLAKTFSNRVQESLPDHSMLLNALDFGEGPSHEIVIVGKPGAEDTMNMLRAIRRSFLPNAVVILKPMSEESPSISRLASFVEYMTARDNKATAYVCTNFKCEFPTNKVDEMLGLLNIKPGKLSENKPEKQMEGSSLQPLDELQIKDRFQ